jgi:hypothetical protein
MAKVANPRVVISPKDFNPRVNNLLMAYNLMHTVYEGNNCFIIPQLV